MELKELKQKLEKELIDIKQKMQEIEELLEKQKLPSETMQDARQHLKMLYDDIVLQYDQIDAMEVSDEVRMAELEKNIYNSLESFDSTYKKAGALFEEDEFGHRDRSVDFKNPSGTR